MPLVFNLMAVIDAQELVCNYIIILGFECSIHNTTEDTVIVKELKLEDTQEYFSARFDDCYTKRKITDKEKRS